MAGPYSLGTVSCWPGHVEQMLRPHGLATTVAALPTAHRRHGLGHRQGRRPHLPRRTSLRHLRGGTPWAAVGPPHDASWRHAARGHRPRQRRAIRDRVSEPYAWTGSTSVAGRASLHRAGRRPSSFPEPAEARDSVRVRRCLRNRSRETPAAATPRTVASATSPLSCFHAQSSRVFPRRIEDMTACLSAALARGAECGVGALWGLAQSRHPIPTRSDPTATHRHSARRNDKKMH